MAAPFAAGVAGAMTNRRLIALGVALVWALGAFLFAIPVLSWLGPDYWQPWFYSAALPMISFVIGDGLVLLIRSLRGGPPSGGGWRDPER